MCGVLYEREHIMFEKKARHFHAGKLRKTVGGIEFVSVVESGDTLFVSTEGLFTSAIRGWKIVPGNIERDGYRRILVGGSKASVARIVYETFVEEIPDGMEIDHINTIRDDNHVENLRVVTHRDNLLNPLTRPRRRVACMSNGAKGAAAQDRTALIENLALGWEAHKRPVIAEKDGGIFAFPTAKEAAERLGLTAQAICHALKGRSRTCGGYTWKYAEVHNV